MRRLEKGFIRGLTSFEARALALLLLLVFAFPSLSKAATDSNLTVTLEAPNSTLRGGLLNLTALIQGAGNVSFSWILPPGFEPLGNLTGFCIPPCQENLTVRVVPPAFGKEEVRLEVRYA